jgi:hypothetical protein
MDESSYWNLWSLSANRDMGLICLSPKKNKLPTQAVYDNAHELKVIIFNKHDFVLRKNKQKSKWQCDFISPAGME